MKQELEQKYTIAWFKLAEFVARGEKERALGLYRLLAHSLNDQALAYQLEGDLLASFKDSNAYQSYQSAAKLYQERMLFAEAIALYELLAQAESTNDDHLKQLVYLYKEQNEIEQMTRALGRLATLYIQQAAVHQFKLVLIEIERFGIAHAMIALLEPLIIFLCKTEHPLEEIALYVEKLRSAYTAVNNLETFNEFLNHLTVQEPDLHKLLQETTTT